MCCSFDYCKKHEEEEEIISGEESARGMKPLSGIDEEEDMTERR